MSDCLRNRRRVGRPKMPQLPCLGIPEPGQLADVAINGIKYFCRSSVHINFCSQQFFSAKLNLYNKDVCHLDCKSLCSFSFPYQITQQKNERPIHGAIGDEREKYLLLQFVVPIFILSLVLCLWSAAIKTNQCVARRSYMSWAWLGFDYI